MPAIEQLTFGLRKDSSAGYAETIERVKAALKEQGFGVLTEIDVKATLKAKIGEDVPPYIILGACNPPLAHRAIAANPEVGMLLPCNVVVRETPGGGVVVEAMDPVAAMGIVQDEAVKAVAQEARDGIAKALEAL
ncbi:MAG: DUF302 domain-containing protein [Chloroflexi bacterium]|jgi:uncharacterized protein (DUF302 family)|nr:DUF302 domain-containing protein [Dehalococcoidia bacterium]MCO5202896.1 DUF302 domain-containing protein [Chloroflexota bacterium]MCZ7577221.1 DUF302 domain-containing protein [Dehalococcoidia bacterium]NJD64092.1 DUF302 domain-containing protein [Chloroflexota bacterium]PWB46712.1 MAG: hypothetical protein C3F10_03735 [Dehalococcoidia bacterium]